MKTSTQKKITQTVNALANNLANLEIDMSQKKIHLTRVDMILKVMQADAGKLTTALRHGREECESSIKKRSAKKG